MLFGWVGGGLAGRAGCGGLEYDVVGDNKDFLIRIYFSNSLAFQ
jgi:hypothetical protein